MEGGRVSAFPRSFRCTECGSQLEVIEDEEIEPCWDCIKRAEENVRNSRLGKSSAQRETEKKIEQKLEEIRKDYQEN